jgi:Glucose-regulated metallo-peptidase M90
MPAAATIAMLMLSSHLWAAVPATQPIPPKPQAHTVMHVEGWTVHVDDRLVSGGEKFLGKRALLLLGHQLSNVTMAAPPEKLARLKEVRIWLDLSHGNLRSAQYHPSKRWLRTNGYDEALTKVVHIPDAAGFVSPRLQHDQPWMVLHELAHAYHDQVLGFDEPRIAAAWRKFVDSKKYNSIRHVGGRKMRHYALTDEKEFFAEMSEAYFGKNDFFPFDAVELEREEPQIYKLLVEIWGPVH